MTFPAGTFGALAPPDVGYIPVWLPGQRLTLSASAAVSAGDILEVSGSGTVAPCTTPASQKFVGVSAQTILWPGPGRVTVYGRGPVHESVCDGPVTAGQELVTSATAGRQVAAVAAPASPPVQGDVNSSRAVIGVALTSAPDGQKCRWMQF